MFDGTLGNYTGTEYKIELLEGAQLYHAKTISYSKSTRRNLKTEVNRIVSLGIFKLKTILNE